MGSTTNDCWLVISMQFEWSLGRFQSKREWLDRVHWLPIRTGNLGGLCPFDNKSVYTCIYRSYTSNPFSSRLTQYTVYICCLNFAKIACSTVQFLSYSWNVFTQVSNVPSTRNKTRSIFLVASWHLENHMVRFLSLKSCLACFFLWQHWLMILPFFSTAFGGFVLTFLYTLHFSPSFT